MGDLKESKTLNLTKGSIFVVIKTNLRAIGRKINAENRENTCINGFPYPALR